MITVTGSLAFDHIMDFPGKFSDHIMPDKIHQINLSFLVTTFKKQRGGTAGNIAYNLALFKMPVSILGVAGVDFAEYENFLKNSGVDISQIKKAQFMTSSAYIMTDSSDNQITAFYPGAMNEADKLQIDKTKADFAVISPNKPEAMISLSLQCQKMAIPYILDPGMSLPGLSADDLKTMLAGATILIGNDYEIGLLMSKLKWDNLPLAEQISKLLENAEVVITTLGEQGSTIQTPSKTIQVNAAKPESTIDPTGAGDAYRAGFLAGYLKRLDLQVCGQIGSMAACYAVEKYGTTNHKFTVEEFCERYKENFGEELKLP